MWRHTRGPSKGCWALPGGALEPGETLEASILRQLAAKVDIREVAHLEQLGTLSDPARNPAPPGARDRLPRACPVRDRRRDPRGHGLAPRRRSAAGAFDHGAIVDVGLRRLRAKLSYTNIGFALAPDEFTLSELRTIYVAALGHPVSATNLQRVLLRRGVLERTGAKREPGKTGGRPAELFRFRAPQLEVTDQFAVLRPPVRS